MDLDDQRVETVHHSQPCGQVGDREWAPFGNYYKMWEQRAASNVSAATEALVAASLLFVLLVNALVLAILFQDFVAAQ